MAVEYVEKFYSRFSAFYDAIFDINVFNNGREVALEFLELAPGDRLLEVGIGTGLSLPLLPKAIEVTGVEISQKVLSCARKRMKSLGARNVRILEMDALHLEFPDSTFNRILAAYFISTVPDPVGVIQEMKRVCRPGGYLVFPVSYTHLTLPTICSV